MLESIRELCWHNRQNFKHNFVGTSEFIKIGGKPKRTSYLHGHEFAKLLHLSSHPLLQQSEFFQCYKTLALSGNDHP